MISQAENSWTLFEAAHLLNRAGFGGSPSDIKALHALGRTPAVESLISPAEPIDAFPKPEWSHDGPMIANAIAQNEHRKAIKKGESEMTAEALENFKREKRREFMRESREQGLEAQGWWFRRMLKTAAPLREKMTLFWHDHFATSIQKVDRPGYLVRQNELFRKYAFGDFRALTQEILLDPAMLLYLDTQNSRKGMPNENFAREVMELFTLGEGNYTENDIREAARAFTGYQLRPLELKVAHLKRQWDDTEKTIFSKTGKYNGPDVINLIFERKETSQFIVKKLWEFFVAENPSQGTVDALAISLQKANFQVGAVLREIFLSKEFYDSSVARSQIKCPIQYLIALLKQLEVSEPPLGLPIIGQQQLGQVLFLPPNVAGWDWGRGWINTNSLLSRYNIAGFLTKGSEEASKIIPEDKQKIPKMGNIAKNIARNWQGPDYEKIIPRPLRQNTADLIDLLVLRFFQAPLPDKVRNSFVEYADAKKGVVFTNKEIAELCHLMLSTPHYQLA